MSRIKKGDEHGVSAVPAVVIRSFKYATPELCLTKNDTLIVGPLHRAPEVPIVIGDGVRRVVDKPGCTVSPYVGSVNFPYVSESNRASISLVL